MTVVIDDYVVSYDKRGKGPVVVLLHGWGDSKQTFSGICSKLEEKYTVITVDLLGFGASDTPRETFDLSKYANFVADFLSKIGVVHIFAFVGHSNGGAIAVKGLVSGTLDAEKLVLLASAGVRAVHTGRKRALKIAAKTVKYPTKILPSRIQSKLKRRAYKMIGSDMFITKGLEDTFRQVVSEDIVLDSALLKQKTLLIYGSEDTATPPDYGRRFHKQISGSKLLLVEGADHFVHQTHASEVSKGILEFLK
jgi:pimeloyl-ACP methyl ester carboxylesterase